MPPGEAGRQSGKKKNSLLWKYFGLRSRVASAYQYKLMSKALVGVIMGSTSDWETMRHTTETLELLGIPYERRVLSAHRTPEKSFEYAKTAEARGLRVIIAGAGGAAHLAGVMAGCSELPVLGVPMESASLKGVDSLYSTVQMPGGIPVATFAIGKPGAVNAALFAAAILAGSDEKIRNSLHEYRLKQTQKVLDATLP